MVKSKTTDDYQKLAEALQLDLLSPAPTSIYTPLTWRCPVCGREYRRSYHRSKYLLRGCRCRSQSSLKAEDYHRLGISLAINWVGKKLPQNVRELTDWLSPDDRPFRASYYQLAYPDRIPKHLHVYLPDETLEQIESLRETKRQLIHARLDQL